MIPPSCPMLYKFSVTFTEAECTSMTLGFELCLLTNFRQRDINKDDISRIVKETFNIGHALFASADVCISRCPRSCHLGPRIDTNGTKLLQLTHIHVRNACLILNAAKLLWHYSLLHTKSLLTQQYVRQHRIYLNYCFHQN